MMMAKEVQERQNVVESARLWIATPYHHRAAVLGSGVDCAQLLNQAFAGAGLLSRALDLGQYNIDWHLHRSEEKYLEVIEQYCHRVDDCDLPLKDRADFTAQPGDILVFKVGRTYSHGAIVSNWPYIIHAYFRARIVEETSIINTEMADYPMRVYSYWGTPG